MKFEEYRKYDGLGLAELVKKKEMKASELLEIAINRAEAVNPTINAINNKLYDLGKSTAESPIEGDFGGVPFLIKDLELQLKGQMMQCGSQSMKGFVSKEDSVTVQRMKAAGLVIFGKTNTPEFGLTPYTEPKLFGATLNPWNNAHTCGGSSGGSAAAVAAGIVPLASASDGGGSIRIPASSCGLFGLKPSRGIVTMGPYVGEAWGGAVSSLCVSRSVRDTAAYLDNVKGPSLGDMYYVRQPETPYLVGSKLSPGRLKIGYSLAHPFPGQAIDSECRMAVLDAVKLLQDLGHTVEEVDLPYQNEALTKHFFFMVVSEVAAEIEHVTKLRGKKTPDINDFEITTWLIGQLGNQFSGKQYAQAKRGWHDLAVDMANFHLNYDFLLTPTLSRPPVTIGELKTKPMEETLFKAVSQVGLIGMVKNSSIIDEMALRSYNYLPFTPIANMTGQPSMSVPLHWQQGTNLPVGVMFTGRMCEETLLLQLANQLEQAKPWFDKMAMQ